MDDPDGCTRIANLIAAALLNYPLASHITTPTPTDEGATPNLSIDAEGIEGTFLLFVTRADVG